LIALIPGLTMAYISGFKPLFYYDLIAFLVYVVIALVPGIPLLIRKWATFINTYGIGLLLIWYLGNYGPGLLYLMAISIFMILFLPDKYAFISFYFNLSSCLIFGWMIYFKEINHLPIIPGLSLGNWIAVSSNLIFFSAVFSFLIPKLFARLENSLNEQYSLQNKLKIRTIKLRKSLKEVEMKNRELEHFNYIASHDLQEPLRMISGFMQLLKTKYTEKLDEKANTYISYAIDGSVRMRQLILDLLEYSRINNITGDAVEINPYQVINEVILTYQIEIDQLKAEITTGPLVSFQGYPSFFSILVQNLIGNALKYSDPDRPPKIYFTMDEKEDNYQFQVSDNGIGIDPDYFDKIFLLFQRLHQRNAYQGTGIGLAIVKKITGILGGEIRVASEVGKGTVFTFTLPKHPVST
jgi:signal transduction histidine kinase